MDAEFAHLVDAWTTGGNCAERFTELLAAPSTSNFNPIPSSDFLFSPSQNQQHQSNNDLITQQNQQQNHPEYDPNQNDMNPHFDCSLFIPESLQFSTVTGSFQSEPHPSNRRLREDHPSIKQELIIPSDSKLSLQYVPTISDISTPPVPSASSSPTKKQATQNRKRRRKTEYSANQCQPKQENLASSSSTCTGNKRQKRSPSTSTSDFSITNNSTQQSSLSKSHTRKCREKVTRQFENLFEVLPSPPKGVEVKHKAQILEYTISIFKSLLTERTSLQAEIALASKSSLLQWMNETISAATNQGDQKEQQQKEQKSTFKQNAQKQKQSKQEQGTMSSERKSNGTSSSVPLSAVLEPFVGLYCVKKKWTYSEVWLVNPGSRHASLSSCVFNSDDNDTLDNFNGFASISRAKYSTPTRLKDGMIARAIAGHRQEWLGDLPSDLTAFPRADLAKKHGLRVAHVVPVILPGQGISAIMLFADNKPHTFSTADSSALLEYSRMLGKFYAHYVHDRRNGSNFEAIEMKKLREVNRPHGDGANYFAMQQLLGGTPVGIEGHSLGSQLSDTSNSLLSDEEFFEQC